MGTWPNHRAGPTQSVKLELLTTVSKCLLTIYFVQKGEDLKIFKTCSLISYFNSIYKILNEKCDTIRWDRYMSKLTHSPLG